MLPGTSGIETHLAPYRGGAMYLVEYQHQSRVAKGNNGDFLIDYAFRSILRRLSITLVSSPSQSTFYGVRPGGALLEGYSAPWILRDRLRELPRRPIVIFPSSTWFPTRNPAEVFGSLSVPILWILREKRSYDHLQSTWGDALNAQGIRLELDHDVVVSSHASVKSLLERYARSGEVSGPILVSRLGIEASNMLTAQKVTAPPNKPPVGMRLRRLGLNALQLLPRGSQTALRRRQTRNRQVVANMRLLQALRTSGVSFPEAPVVDFDISDPSLASFDEFCTAIARASIVATNRLHVAIPSIILGKRTFLVDSGYHKLSGVFEHSLADISTVRLLQGEMAP